MVSVIYPQGPGRSRVVTSPWYTVQRDEPQLGLPVHRLGAKNRATSVMAFSDEIDLWLRCRTHPPVNASLGDKLDQATKALEDAYAAYQVCLRHYVEIR